MKNTDIAMIVLIATISVVASYFLGNAIVGNPSEKVEQIAYVESVDDYLSKPDAEIFHDGAINPTVEVYIGNCGPIMVWNAEKQVCETPSDEDTTDDDDAEGGDSETKNPEKSVDEEE